MPKPVIPQFQPSLPHGISSRNDSALAVSEALKRVDQLIRKGDLQRAQGELIQAKKLDPRNMYTIALEERISILIEELDRRTREQNNKNPLSSVEKNKLLGTQGPFSPLPPTPMEAMSATISSSRLIELDPPRNPNQPIIHPSEGYPAPKQDATNDRSIEIACYRDALVEAWRDGALTADEERQLQELRTVLEISEPEHKMLEKIVKRSSYKNAITQNSPNGLPTHVDAAFLAQLQQVYQISKEEHTQIQNQYPDTKQTGHQDTILVIDDDVQFLTLLHESIQEEGFEVTSVTTSDEAYTRLQENIPDLILCDVNLETSTLNGFAFYEKVQENINFQQIPFLFLTGLKDEKLTRIGKELGADDYLMKPISMRTLLSAIRGRIKRFKQLRNLNEVRSLRST